MVEIEDDICAGVSFHLQDMEASVVAVVAIVTVRAGRRRSGERNSGGCHNECEHRAECERSTHESSLRSGCWVGSARATSPRAPLRRQAGTESSPGTWCKRSALKSSVKTSAAQAAWSSGTSSLISLSV